MNEKVIYLNGAFVPESEAKVSVLDWGFSGGDGVYEVARTFDGKLFRLETHLARLSRSLAYTRIDCGLSMGEIEAIARETVERNLPLLEEGSDYALWHVISRGDRRLGDAAPATVTLYCLEVGFAGFAHAYLNGLKLVTPGVRRTPPQCADPKAKLTNRMNQLQAKFEAQQSDPEALPLMLDIDGNIAESNTANFFFVADGKLCTPKARNVLGGITRKTVIELAHEIGIEVVEDAFVPYDVYTADEAFLSGTSGTMLPAKSLNGSAIGDGTTPGPVTMRLIHAWNELVGMDFVAQALGHLGDNERGPALAEWERRLAA